MFKSESYNGENKFYNRELRIYRELACVLERFYKSKVCFFLVGSKAWLEVLLLCEQSVLLV